MAPTQGEKGRNFLCRAKSWEIAGGRDCIKKLIFGKVASITFLMQYVIS